MSNKEERLIKTMRKTVTKLDKYLEEVSDTDEKKKIKIHYAQMRANHEIKKLLHELNAYDNYEEKELKKFNKYYGDERLTKEDITYIDEYFINE